jgi:hypothetical protein
LIGGSIILFAVLLQFYKLLMKSKKNISHWHSKFFVRIYLTTGETTDYRSAEGATTQESLRQKDRKILTLERD